MTDQLVDLFEEDGGPAPVRGRHAMPARRAS
jgi:hypothetical protein